MTLHWTHGSESLESAPPDAVKPCILGSTTSAPLRGRLDPDETFVNERLRAVQDP